MVSQVLPQSSNVQRSSILKTSYLLPTGTICTIGYNLYTWIQEQVSRPMGTPSLGEDYFFYRCRFSDVSRPLTTQHLVEGLSWTLDMDLERNHGGIWSLWDIFSTNMSDQTNPDVRGRKQSPSLLIRTHSL